MLSRREYIPTLEPRSTLPILSAGCDWLTTTTKNERQQALVRFLAQQWIKTQEQMGHEVKDFAWNGYVGHRTEGISWGQRGDGTLVRLSGEQARLHAPVLAPRVDHVSRVDFQVTAGSAGVSRDWAEVAADSVSGDNRVSSGQTALALLQSNRSQSTLYLGRRVSDRFFRIYDKTSESDGAWPENSWRFEVEFKGARTDGFRLLLRKPDWRASDAVEVVRHHFRDYGFACPFDVLPLAFQDKTPRQQTTDEGRLRYLGTCIRPMVRRLAEAYGRDVIRDLLDLGDKDPDINIE